MRKRQRKKNHRKFCDENGMGYDWTWARVTTHLVEEIWTPSFKAELFEPHPFLKVFGVD